MHALAPLLSLLLAAASPASDEAQRLLEAGRDREALAVAERGAAQGDADSISYLAWMYDRGRYVAQDQARAAQLYRRAAEAGHRHAQWRLGVMLDLGEGVAEDPEEAFLWISRAAAQGSALAAASMGVMYANGRGVAVDYAESRRWYLEAARLGEAGGFYGIAALYANGQGVELDPVEALAWMLVAATLGDERAQQAVERFGLSPEETQAAADRGNAILGEFGLDGHQIRFRNLDSKPAVPVAA